MCPEIAGTRHPRIDAPDGQWFAKELFAATYSRSEEEQRVCRGCVANHVRACCICKKDKPSTDFTKANWEKRISLRKCQECMLGGFAVFARNREQNAHLQLENGSSQMRNVHAFNARSIVAACAKKTRANGDFLVNNPQRMLQTTCATIVTGSVAADATKTKQNYKDFSHAVWDLDVGSPELLCTECFAGQKQEDFGNAPISVAVIRNHIQSSALPSQSMERECIVMLNNVMLAWKDVKKN
jgi:hypothetical protein